MLISKKYKIIIRVVGFFPYNALVPPFPEVVDGRRPRNIIVHAERFAVEFIVRAPRSIRRERQGLAVLRLCNVLPRARRFKEKNYGRSRCRARPQGYAHRYRQSL